MTGLVIERAHALCAPSAWEQWGETAPDVAACAGSVAMQIAESEETSSDAAEGIEAHDVGRRILLAQPTDDTVIGIDPEMREYVMIYVKSCRDRMAEYKQAGAIQVHAWVEERLSIEEITGEKDAKGTADFVILAVFADGHSVLEVDDLKYGLGVLVDVINNGQLQLYALAAVLKHRLLHNITQVVMRIHQVRIREIPLEWQISIKQLYEFGQRAAERAGVALRILEDGPVTAIGHLNPSEKSCRFCRAKYKCPALAKQVQEIVLGKFQDLGDEKAMPLMPQDRSPEPLTDHAMLGLLGKKVPLIEDWCRAIRSKIESALLKSEPVPGWKLVEGRKGSRQWREPERVEALLLQANIAPNVIYYPKELLSPTAMEKVIKKTRPNEWAMLTASFITQADGKPSVAEELDPRPAWVGKSAPEDFDTYDGSSLV